MYYGGDYNPEQWPEDVWPDDVRLMREAGVNLVSLGIFSWARIQPEEGVFDFDWLDRIIALLHEGGVGVDLATATASPPPWAVERYPDILPVTADGVVLQPGSRQHYAPTSPDYRRLAKELVTRLAERYASHPAVKMWHVNNEYACHVHEDYSEHAQRAFREWLERRYESIDRLNAAWGTAFWSQIYRSFDQIRVPRRAPYSQSPAAVLDFRRFTSDAVLELYVMERDVIRAAGATQPITTNFMGAFRPMDYRRWAEEVDIVTDDSYPDPRDPESFRHAAFTRDLMRSLKPGAHWLLMEQASDAVNWRPSNRQKAPGQMAAWSEQAIARGSDGVMFFQWRQSRSGAEKFHSAMLPHAGRETRTWREIEALGQSLADRDAPALPEARVAILFDWQNWWALELPDHPARIDYVETVRTWYDALHVAHVQTDVVDPTADLSGYRLVIAPAQYLLTDSGASNLRSFVAGGGVLVTTPFTDIVDENDRFLADGFSTRLAEVFGGRPVGFDGLLPEDGLSVVFDGDEFAATTLREDFVTTTGTSVADMSDAWAAVVENRYGEGVSLHCAVFLDRDGAGKVLARALSAADVSAVLPDVPAQVEVVRGGDTITLINQARTAAAFTVGGREITLAPFGVASVAVASVGVPDAFGGAS